MWYVHLKIIIVDELSMLYLYIHYNIIQILTLDKFNVKIYLLFTALHYYFDIVCLSIKCLNKISIYILVLFNLCITSCIISHSIYLYYLCYNIHAINFICNTLYTRKFNF